MKFKIGDVCEIVAPEHPEYHGRECTVIAAPSWMDDCYDLTTGESMPPGMFYTIDIPGDHGPTYALEHELRLKRPPQWDSWIYDTREVRAPNELAPA